VAGNIIQFSSETDVLIVGEVQPVTRSSRTTIFSFIAAALLAASTAHAIPALQLYSPDAIYDVSSQTWIINKSTFELYVIGDVQNKGTIYDVDLVASVYGSGGNITITPDLAIDPTPEDALAYSQVINHAEYANADDHFFYHLGDLDKTDQVIQDYTGSSGGTSMGTILALTVSVSGYDAVHFDAFDHYLTGGNGNGAQASYQTHMQGVFAPFSHDATQGTPPDAPEPGSMALFAMGMGAMALAGRRKKS
jgi:PEP-CTERM motif-containing protein